MSKISSELLDRLARHASETPGRVAVREIASGRTITYGELHAVSTQFAAKLSGGVAMLRSSNRIEFHIAFFAALAAGMTVFPVSPDVTDHEFASASRRAGADAVIEGDLSVKPFSSNDQYIAPALLLQSSGTTGLPKIVRRELPSLDAVAAQMVKAIEIERDDKVLSCVPLCHSYGLEHGLLAPMFAGATVYLAYGFDLASVRRELFQSNITIFPAVPSIYEILGNLPDFNRFPALRVPYSAGGPLPATVWSKMSDHYGVRIGQLYGATEIGSVTFAHPALPHFKPASVGRAMERVELRVDDEGQLFVRAASMMSFYVGDDSPVTRDGFFPTGDLARLDDHGNLFITGRLKLLIDVGGLKVNPLEVELAISEHPAVGACVVVPMRLSETVSRLKAILTPADADHPPTSDELRLFVRSRLSAHKIPRVFELRDSLPRSATGKVLRHLLVESS